MNKFEYVITDEMGIHARPAGLFVKCAAKFSSKITVESKGKLADAKRLFAVMGLGVKQGDTINVTVEGEDGDEAVQKLEEFCKENF